MLQNGSHEPLYAQVHKRQMIAMQNQQTQFATNGTGRHSMSEQQAGDSWV